MKTIVLFYAKLLAFSKRVLSWAGIPVHWLLAVGSSRDPAHPVVLLWPRIDSIDEAQEQLWRANYYLPEFEVVLWVGPKVKGALSGKPAHVGDVRAQPRLHRSVRTSRDYISCLWRVLREGGKILIWRKRKLRGYNLLLAFLGSICAPEAVDRWNDKWACETYIRVRNRLLKWRPDTESSRQRFLSCLEKLPRHDRCYLIGTGPSLSLADHLDFSDGYRIVCNTIVRDHALLERIRPHFIAAADAIYHFGYTKFAFAFRSDLARLLENQDTFLVFPDLYDEIARREMPAVRAKLIAVPSRSASGSNFNLDLRRDFCLLWVGNVLNRILLPLASTLARQVYLLGFDGRAPDDRYFWKYSGRHNYNEYFDTLKRAHPAFYSLTDYKEYQARLMDDLAGRILSEGEKRGIRYIPMAPSFSKALARRWQPGWFSQRYPDERKRLSEWEKNFREKAGGSALS